MTATTVSQAVEKREAGIVSVMWGRKSHFAAVLPDHVEVKSFLGTAAAALYADPKLMRAAEQNPDSLITAMMRCAALGHQPGTDEFYLLWRNIYDKEAKVKRPTVQGLEGYRGIIERMYRSGAVRSVIVREVCAKDRFKFVEGDMDKPAHHFGGGEGFRTETGADFFGATGTRSRGEMVGVYAYAILTTGAVSRVVILSRDDVMAAREASDSKDSDYSPWNRLDGGKDHPEFTGRSMWWKTAARRLEPWVPTSAEYRREQLRAAVQAAGPAAQPPAQNGAAHVAPEPVYEAEIVDDPGPAVPDETPVSGPAAGPGTSPSKAATEKLSKLLGQIPLGEDHDIAALLSWLTGKPDVLSGQLTAADVRTVTSFLEDHLKEAGNDVAEVASRAWQQYRAANHQSGDGSA